MMRVRVINDASIRVGARLLLYEKRMPILRRLAEYKITRLKKNLMSGVGPDGKRFAKVRPWTRIAGITRGQTAAYTAMKPLMNTGQMMNSIAPIKITNDIVVIGGIGKQQDKINRMVNGTPGRMRVSDKSFPKYYSGIKTGRNGKDYCRIKTPVGWRTKQVVSGTIKIKPIARQFMYFTKDDIIGMNKMVDRFVERNRP